MLIAIRLLLEPYKHLTNPPRAFKKQQMYQIYPKAGYLAKHIDLLISFLTEGEIEEQHKRLDIPMSLEALKEAQAVALKGMQQELFEGE